MGSFLAYVLPASDQEHDTTFAKETPALYVIIFMKYGTKETGKGQRTMDLANALPFPYYSPSITDTSLDTWLPSLALAGRTPV